jgi:hypothetical protein
VAYDGRRMALGERWWLAATLTMVLMSRASTGQMVSEPGISSSGVTSRASSVVKVPSTVALTVTTPLTVFYGEAIDGLAQVTANDGSTVTGTVTFYDGTTSFCTLTLQDGASCSAGAATGFGAGVHVFTAVYSGDATHDGATSNAVSVTVAQDTTTTTIASSANPVAAGGGVVYTATVVGAHGPASGSVTFLDGATSMGSAVVTNGVAALSVVMMSPGIHVITAVYAGNEDSAGSTSVVLSEMVQAPLAATTTTLRSDANPAVSGQSVMFTATVSAVGGPVPGGMVTFLESGTALGSATVNSAGVAVWASSALSVGSHSIVARYEGDSQTTASVSEAMNEVVNQAAAPDGFTISVDPITVAAGNTAVAPVKVTMGSGFGKAVSLSCSGLPDEASCSFVSNIVASSGGTATLKISTAGPRDCGSWVPYGILSRSSGWPVAGPALAGLMAVVLPRRLRAVRRLLGVVCAVVAIGAMTGCGAGHCTDLGTRPGSYMITVTGSSGGMVVSQKVRLVVKP